MIKEIIVTEPIQEYFYDITHNMNCYPIVLASDNKDTAVSFDDKNNCYITNMKGFTGMIILVED